MSPLAYRILVLLTKYAQWCSPGEYTRSYLSTDELSKLLVGNHTETLQGCSAEIPEEVALKELVDQGLVQEMPGPGKRFKLAVRKERGRGMELNALTQFINLLVVYMTRKDLQSILEAITCASVQHGECPLCHCQDVPIDKEGNVIKGDDISSADEFREEHDEDCPVTLIEQSYTYRTGMVTPQILPITSQMLLSPRTDLAIYQVQPGDAETPAQISIADLREVFFAIAELGHRINDLVNGIVENEILSTKESSEQTL